MTPAEFLSRFGTIADAPNGIPKLRELILQLAVQGKLFRQDPGDEPARVEPPSSKLPFPIPAGWSWPCLGDLGTFLGGGTPSKKNGDYWNGPIPWVSPKDMKVPYIATAQDSISATAVDESATKLIPTGAILMVTRGMILAHSFPVALTTAVVTINQDMKALVLNSSETGEYLLRALQASRHRMLENVERSSHGTCRLDSEKISGFQIPIPPLAEQHRIVAKVDELMALCDELEARQRRSRTSRRALTASSLDALANSPDADSLAKAWPRVRDHLDLLIDEPESIPTLRQTILQLAVRGRLVPQDPNDEPAAVLLERLACGSRESTEMVDEEDVDADSVDIHQAAPFTLPTSWVWTHLSDLGLLDRGRSRHRPRNDPRLYEGGQYPVVQTGDVARASRYVTTFTGLYNHFGLGQSKLWPKGTLCITIAANIGDSSLLGFDACFPDSVVGFVPAEEFGDACYFDLFVRTAKAQLETYAPSTAQKNINLKVLHALRVPLPPVAEMRRIVAKVDELMALCDQLESRLTQSRTLTQTLASSTTHHLVT